MIIKLRLFAMAKDLVNSDSLELQLDSGATINELKFVLSQRSEAMADVVKHSMFAIDDEYVGNETPLADNIEVAVIPPVSGG